MKTKALIFDLDGVIVDTAKYHFLAWKSLSDELGLVFNEQINERLKGVSRMRSFEIILEENGAEKRFSEAEKEEYIKKKNDLYVSFIKRLTPDDMLPGVAEFIGKAKEHGLKTAVASVSKNAPAVLEALGATDKFDYVADAAKVGRSKPAPDIFLVCAEALGVDPADCIGIEDAQAGIEAIKAAGMYSVGINVTVTSVEPDLHLKSTSQLDFEKIVFR
ncbi:MAG: beta-phosphoglucomutase [Clostridia bacterium]|nr:beta-phosphoglucomutase [Clostridia bacterium]